MRQIARASLLLCLALGGMAGAQETGEPAVVVELFTSQGCSSCPPADDFLAMLAANPEVIPLALHVDYWDYIGWKDKFGNPKFTERQKAYARQAGSRMVYTPQLIVGGLDRVEGNQPAEVEALIRRHQDVAHGVTLSLSRKGSTLEIQAQSQAAFGEPVRVQLVRYRPHETVSIERGENAGRTVTYHNIVTSWQALGDWTGEEPLALDVSAPGEDPAVVIVQRAGPSAILAAARID